MAGNSHTVTPGWATEREIDNVWSNRLTVFVKMNREHLVRRRQQETDRKQISEHNERETVRMQHRGNIPRLIFLI